MGLATGSSVGALGQIIIVRVLSSELSRPLLHFGNGEVSQILERSHVGTQDSSELTEVKSLWRTEMEKVWTVEF